MCEGGDPGVEQWGKRCHAPTGLCSSDLQIYYCIPPPPCSGGGVGRIGILDIPLDKIQETLDACTEKFWGEFTKTNCIKLVGAGMLSKAGLQPGDILEAIDETFPEGLPKMHTMELHWQEILTWQLTAPKLSVLFRRNGKLQIGEMDNPAFNE